MGQVYLGATELNKLYLGNTQINSVQRYQSQIVEDDLVLWLDPLYTASLPITATITGSEGRWLNLTSNITASSVVNSQQINYTASNASLEFFGLSFFTASDNDAYTSDDFTVQWWFNPRLFNSINTLYTAAILGQGGGIDNAFNKWYLGVGGPNNGPGSGSLVITTSNNVSGSLDWVFGKGQFVTGSWQNLAVTRNGNDFTAYLNGVQIATTSSNVPRLNTQSNPLNINHLPLTVTSDSFRGSIGQILYYTSSLQDFQVYDNYLTSVDRFS